MEIIRIFLWLYRKSIKTIFLEQKERCHLWEIWLFVLWVQCCVLRRKCKWASLPDRFDEGFITSKHLEANNILPEREHHDSISWLTLQHIFSWTFCTVCVHVSAVGGADYPPVKQGVSCTTLIRTQISQHTQLHQWPVVIALL